jgi:hypothetical protein
MAEKLVYLATYDIDVIVSKIGIERQPQEPIVKRVCDGQRSAVV